MDRRDVLKSAGLVALAAATRRLSARPRDAWPPFRDMLAIDGSSGTNLEYLEPGDPAIAQELDVLRRARMTAIMVTVAPQGRFWLDDAAFARAKTHLDLWHRLAATYPSHLTMIETGDDLARAHREGRTGIIPWFQGTEPFGEDLERIPMFRAKGIRVVQLTHNRRNLVGDGALEDGNAGLSRYGHDVIRRLEAEKIVVDLAHGAQRTIKEGIAACTRPMLISHTGCRALSDLTRNTTDAELRAMADKGGVAGMIFWPYLRTDTQPTSADLIAHIEHAVNVCGEDHVGIGTDTGVAPIERSPQFETDNRAMIRDMKAQGIFDAARPDDLYTFLPDLNTPDRFERLGAMLARRGHSTTRIGKILGGNLARVMREIWG